MTYRLLWNAFQHATDEELNLEVSIPAGECFRDPGEVLAAIRQLVGHGVLLMLHVDNVQVGQRTARGSIGVVLLCTGTLK